MSIILLGSGTSIPLPYRASPSVLWLGENGPVLMDMGPGTLQQLSKIGINHDKITHILISHFHPDHTADLIHFLFVTRYFPGLKYRDPLILTGPTGIVNFIKKIQRAYGTWLDVPDKHIKIEEMDIHKSDRRSYRGYELISQPVKHSLHSLAYRIEITNGKHFVYSGDTAFCDEIVDISQGCDLLILECASPENKPMEGHLTPSQAGRIASLSKTKKLVLTHFYPDVLKTDIVGNCRKTYSGELIIGSDRLHLRI
jgi:ribonuclease BN (tRNA processing enzyme)